MSSGFVYIWRDRKRKMFYVGSHWGAEDDGYICSSNHMRNAYARRPQDFKRRIIKRVTTNRQDLYDAEQTVFNMIRPEERGVKYYNQALIVKPYFTHEGRNHREEVRKRQSEAAKRRPPMSEETKQKIRDARAKQVFSEESKQKRAESVRRYNETLTPQQIEARMSKAREWFDDPDNAARISVERSERAKRLRAEGKIGRKALNNASR